MTSNQDKELHEQVLFIQWCQEQDHLVGSINNGIAPSGWKTFNKLRRLSCADKGVPDVLLVLNPKYRADKKPLLLFVEMKRADGKGVTSPEQKRWINGINSTIHAYATVAHGCQAAKDYVRSFYQEPHDQPRKEN